MSSIQTLREKAKRFYDLHHQPGHILILPNAWDVVTARVFEDAGFPAVATSSGGVSTSLGYPDGQNISRSEMLGVVGRMAHALNIPLSADLEAGYGDSDEEMDALAQGLIEAGAVGLNLEDSTRNPKMPLQEIGVQCRKIRALRRACEARAPGVHLFINARTDAFRVISEKNAAVEEAVMRGRAYVEAGADCIFLFGASDGGAISEVVGHIGSPVNVILGPRSPNLDELERMGVARITFGTSMARASIGAMKNIASALKERKRAYGEVFADAITFDELNRLSQPANDSVSPTQ